MVGSPGPPGSPKGRGRGSLQVVLLSSARKNHALGELVKELKAKGVRVEKVMGVDLDGELLMSALRSHRRGALYVICRDHHLDEHLANHLRTSLLHSQKVLDKYVVTLTLRPQTTKSDAAALATKARLLGERQPPDASRGPGSAGIQKIAAKQKSGTPITAPHRVMPPPGSTSKTRSAPQAQREVSLEVEVEAEAEAEIRRVPTPPPTPAKPKRPPTPVASAPREPQPAAVLEAVDHGQARAPVPPPKSDPVKSQPPSSAQPLGAVHPPRLDVHEPEFDAMEEGITAGSRRRKAGILAGISALGIAVAAVVVLGTGGFGTDDLKDSPLKAQAMEQTPEEKIAVAKAKFEAESAARTEAEEKAAKEAAVAKAAEDEAYAEQRAAAARGELPSAKAPEEAGSDADDDELDLELEDAEPELTQSQDALVVAALTARHIRSLDMLLLDPRRSKKGTLEQARAHCADREVHGVTGWRLPQIGEISALVSSSFLLKDYYWTETIGDTSGSRQLVYDGRHRKIKSMSPRFKGARGVCVRNVKMP